MIDLYNIGLTEDGIAVQLDEIERDLIEEEEEDTEDDTSDD